MWHRWYSHCVTFKGRKVSAQFKYEKMRRLFMNFDPFTCQPLTTIPQMGTEWPWNCQAIGRSGGGTAMVCLPLRVQILWFWYTNSSKHSHLGSWCSPLYEVGTPYGNPGSATASVTPDLILCFRMYRNQAGYCDKRHLWDAEIVHTNTRKYCAFLLFNVGLHFLPHLILGIKKKKEQIKKKN